MMSRISLWVIGGATVLAFFLGRVIDARPESFQKVLFVGLFLLLAISTSLIVRFIVLPSLARDIHKPRESLYVTAYTEATFPAVLTVVWSIFVSEWWVAVVGGVIAVVDDGGNLMYLERLDDTFAAGARISIGKARTAALFRKPTAAFEEIIRNGRTPMIALEDFTPLQGGIPIEVEGKVVGAIGVSGAANQQRDEDVAKAGAAALK